LKKPWRSPVPSRISRKFPNNLKRHRPRLQAVTQHLLKVAQNHGSEHFLADATLYLEFFGIIAIAWQWLLQGIAVQKTLKNDSKKTELNFYLGKMHTLRYFYSYELPKTLGLAQRLQSGDGLTVEMESAFFND
jgi:hypothetical protein